MAFCMFSRGYPNFGGFKSIPLGRLGMPRMALHPHPGRSRARGSARQSPWHPRRVSPAVFSQYSCFLNVFLQPARAINQKSFEFKPLRTINRSSWRVHHMTYWDGKGCKQRSRVKPQLARWYCSILFGVDIPLFQVAKPKHPEQYDLLESFCSKLL